MLTRELILSFRAASFLGLVLVPATLAAQPGLRVTRFDRLSTADGLSDPLVMNVHQDRQGFLWLGTLDGLDRFDGTTVRTFKHRGDDPDSLVNALVRRLYEDRQGRLWIGTVGGGLDRFDRDGERFVHYRPDRGDGASLSHGHVNAILEDRHGRLWVGTEGGLDRLRPESGGFKHYRHDPTDPTSLAHDQVESLFEDHDGRLWIGTEGGLDRYDPETDGFVHLRHDPADPRSLGHPKVVSITEDAAGFLWVGTERGLDRFDRESGTFTHYRHDPADPRSLPEGQVLALHVDRRGELWVGTFSWLARYDRENGTFVRYVHDPFDPRSLGGSTITDIFEDRTGLLWFATRNGVSRYDPQAEQFALYRPRSGGGTTLSSRNVSGIAEDHAGELWVGTYDGGLNRLDRERRRVVQYRPDAADPGSLPSDLVFTVAEDRERTLWVGTGGGLARFDRETERFVCHRHDPRDPESLPQDNVTALYQDGAGRHWVGTWAGLSLFDPVRERFLDLSRDWPVLKSEGWAIVRSILEDHAGVLWVASMPGGLFRLGPIPAGDAFAADPPLHERFTSYQHDPNDPESLSSNMLYALHEDDSGALWIGTLDGGLDRLDPDRRRFTHYSRQDGLPGDRILGILEDGQGWLWLSTDRGLVRFHPRSGHVERFGASDGLQDDAWNVGSAFKSPSGEMFFGGPQGLNAFFPDRITRRPPLPPPVVLTGLSLFDEPARPRRDDPDSPLVRPITETEELVLSHRHRVVTFGLAVLDYVAPEKNRYAYRLEGFDPAWIETDASRRHARYTNLDPGNYVFRVRGANADGVWNEEGRSLRLVVLPPPWKTWWAITLYTLAAVTVAGSYVRAHRKKLARERQVNRMKSQLLEERGELIEELRQRNSELAQVNASLAHDLRSPLVTIRNYVDLIKKDVSSGDVERFGEDLVHVRRAAEDMLRMLDELHELTRLGQEASTTLVTVELDELVRDAARPLLARFAEAGGALAVADGGPRLFGDRQRLIEMTRALLDNALRFRGDAAPRVEVTAGSAGGEVVVSVRDNGIGVPARYQERIFNLFESLDPTVGGIGVGLALARRIVELHGGRIWVESEGPGRGSTFRFSLPAGEGR